MARGFFQIDFLASKVLVNHEFMAGAKLFIFTVQLHLYQIPPTDFVLQKAILAPEMRRLK